MGLEGGAIARSETARDKGLDGSLTGTSQSDIRGKVGKAAATALGVTKRPASAEEIPEVDREGWRGLQAGDSHSDRWS